MFRRLFFAILLVIIIWLGLLSNPAVSQQVESRLNNLQFDLNRIESRLDQIESRLNQIQQSPSPRTPIIVPPGSRRTVSQTEREQMFDKLATLVIELKEQVNNLEVRVSQLEYRSIIKPNF
jgi:tetrahydromethanopterin S-methyltransferase subunit B